mgnify:CR=1 FL=1
MALFFDIAAQEVGGLAPENRAFFCYGAREKGGAESREKDRSKDLHRTRILARSFGGLSKMDMPAA